MLNKNTYQLQKRSAMSLPRGMRAALNLIETSIVLIIVTAAMAAGANIYSAHLENRTNQITAQEMTKVSSAFGRYLKDNYGLTLQKAMLAGGIVEVPVSELTHGGYLYDTFENRNPFGQEYKLTARYIAASGPGENDRLESVIYTVGGETIRPGAANSIAQMVGAGGGFTMPNGDTSEVRSTFGGFTLDLQSTYNRDPGPGKLVSAMFFDDEGSLVSDFLYRNAVPGRPDLNTMNTAINMDGHNVDSVGALNTNTANVSSKLTSADVDVTGRLVNTGESTLVGQVGIGGSAAAGYAMSVTGNANVTGNVRTSSATVTGALAANTASVSGALTSGSLATTGSLAANTASVSGSLSSGSLSTGALNANSGSVSGALSTGSLSTGAIAASGRITSSEYIHLNRVATENGTCSPNGLVARNSAGLILSCQSGRWKQGTGGGGACTNPAGQPGATRSVTASISACQGGHNLSYTSRCTNGSWVVVSMSPVSSQCNGGGN